MSTKEDEIFLPVPQKHLGQVIGKGGKRIIQIEHETGTRIKSVNDPFGKGFGFLITGTTIGREEAKQAITRYLVSAIILVSYMLPSFVCPDLYFFLKHNVKSLNQECRLKL